MVYPRDPIPPPPPYPWYGELPPPMEPRIVKERLGIVDLLLIAAPPVVACVLWYFWGGA